MPKVRKKRTEALGGAVGRAQTRQMVLAGGRLLHPSPWGSQRVFSKQMAQLDSVLRNSVTLMISPLLEALALEIGTPSPSLFPLK